MKQEARGEAVSSLGGLLPGWIGAYERGWLRADIVAGLTAAAVVAPKALAYATVAGLPVQVGLYTAFVPGVIYAVLGTSRPLSVSSTATLAILTGATLMQAVPDGDPSRMIACTATLTALVGAILVLASLLRLGFVANFISDPVLTGFKAGIGIVIVLDQLPKLFGIHFAKGDFVHNVVATISGLPQTSAGALAVACATIALLLVMERLAPRLPAPLVAVAAGIAATGLLDLPAHGVEIVGHVPTGLPALVMPDLALVGQLAMPAAGIALMSFTETIAAGRAFASGDEPVPQANRELLATGIGNLAGALSGAMPGGGGTSQTAVSRSAGARSQLAGLVVALVCLAIMLWLAPLIGKMPQATLAAVVVVYSVGLIDPGEFRRISAIRRTELVWALTAMIGVVLLGTLQGIVVAIAVSLLALAHQVSDPPLHVLGRKPGTSVFRPSSAEHPEDERYPGLLLLRPEGRIFFVNAERLAQKMRPLIASADPRVVVLDLRAVFDLEYTALKMLIKAEERARQDGIAVWLVGMNPGVLNMVQRSSLGAELGTDRMFFRLEEAVERYLRSLPPGPPGSAPAPEAGLPARPSPGQA